MTSSWVAFDQYFAEILGRDLMIGSKCLLPLFEREFLRKIGAEILPIVLAEIICDLLEDLLAALGGQSLRDPVEDQVGANGFIVKEHMDGIG